MSWFSKLKPPKVSSKGEKRSSVPDGMWLKCPDCSEIQLRSDIEKNLSVCPKCDYHFKIPCRERLSLILDDGSFEEFDTALIAEDPLKFKDSKKYPDRMKSSQKSTGEPEAFVYGTAKIQNIPVVAGSFVFKFMGGSMGSVVGEKIARAFERAAKDGVPAIIFSASGGARMQEGILSLMQMAKTTVALSKLREKNLPYISVMTDPTTGGVAASFAMLGDINIAEPKALIGFAGPRVIEQTIKEKLPEGFQRSEFLLDHGMLDMVVHRRELRSTLASLLGSMTAPGFN